MSTNTTLLTATRDWQPLTDGRTDCLIQIIPEVDICRSATKPADNAPYLRFSQTTLTITAPDIAWIRAAHRDTVPVWIW